MPLTKKSKETEWVTSKVTLCVLALVAAYRLSECLEPFGLRALHWASFKDGSKCRHLNRQSGQILTEVSVRCAALMPTPARVPHAR